MLMASLQGSAQRAGGDDRAGRWLFDFLTTRTTSPAAASTRMGGNEKAAKPVGHPHRTAHLHDLRDRWALLAALAGLVFAARLNTATPKAGLGFELDVIAACFIGGCLRPRAASAR